MFFVGSLLIISAVFQDSTSLLCYECQGDGCRKKDLEVVKCSKAPLTTVAPTTITADSNTEVPTEKVPAEVSLVEEITSESLENTIDNTNLTKSEQNHERKRRHSNDPWKCFIKHEGMLEL